MPLYEYRCKACGHRFEKIQSFSAPDEKECPVCHSEVERLISAPAVQFKGSGFYSTDYPSRSSAAPKAEGSGKDGASSEGSSSKSEGSGKDAASSSSGDSGSKPSSGSDSTSSAAAPSSSSPGASKSGSS